MYCWFVSEINNPSVTIHINPEGLIYNLKVVTKPGMWFAYQCLDFASSAGTAQ